MEEIDGYRDGSLRDYVSALARQKVIFVLVAVLVPAAALGFSLAQQGSYQANAEVLINGLSSSPNADRVAETEASVARTPVVALRAIRAANVRGMTTSGFLAQSSVDANANADLLDFSVTDSDPLLAETLVNAYVRQFTAYRAEFDAAPLVQQIQAIRSKIASLERDPAKNSSLLAVLRSKETQLEATEQVLVPDVRVLDTATRASKISPRPKLYLLLGVILGLVLGSGLAVLADALAPQVRSPAEVVEALGLPLLGLVPQIRSREREGAKLAMVGDPDGAEAQAVRMLKTKLVLANASRPARVIMLASAVGDDGRSELAANLAISLAHGQRRVTLVDIDLLHPVLAGLFGVPARRGLTDVVSGAVSLEEALVPLEASEERPQTLQGQSATRSERRLVRRAVRGARDTRDATPRSRSAAAADAGWLDAEAGGDWAGFNAERRGELQVLFSGSSSARDAELVESEIFPKVIKDLRSVSDFVLINAPPLLRVGDGIMVATMVDALVVVASARQTRRSDLSELRRVIATLPPLKLGVIVTGADQKPASRSGARDLATASVGSAPLDSGRPSDLPAPL